MADSEKTDSIEQRSAVAAKHFSRYLLLSVLALLLVLACLAGGGLTLKKVVEQVTAMTADQPLSRFEVFNEAIDDVKKNVEAQYAEHTQKMEADNILEMNVKFNGIYTMAHESEKSFTLQIKHFQSGMYQLASRTRGSGEWFKYYKKDIESLQERGLSRSSKLMRYTKKDSARKP
jgi:hypothetical protein